MIFRNRGLKFKLKPPRWTPNVVARAIKLSISHRRWIVQETPRSDLQKLSFGILPVPPANNFRHGSNGCGLWMLNACRASLLKPAVLIQLSQSCDNSYSE